MEDEKKQARPGQEGKNPREEKSQSHRGNSKDGNRPEKGQHQKESKLDNFRGNHEALAGHVYTYDGYARASEFRKTTEKIGEWAKQSCSNFPLDVWKCIETLEKPDQNTWRPDAPEDMDDPVESAIFKEEVQEFSKRKRAYRDNSTTVYTVVVGQCSESTKAKLESLSDWEEIKQDHDLVRLLKAIKSLLHNQIQDQCYEGVTAFESLKSLMNIRQQRHEETAEYCKRFLTTREVLEHVVVSFGAQFQGIADGLLASEFNTTREAASDQQAIECEYLAGERVLAVMFIKQACKIRYGELFRELQNDFLKGKNNYPINITAANKMLANWKQYSRPSDPSLPLDGMTYTMADGESFKKDEEGYDREAVLATDGQAKTHGKDYSNYVCNNCNEKGHVWRKCPRPYSAAAGGTANAMVDNDSESSHPWGATFAEDGMFNDGAVLAQVDVTLPSSAKETTTSYDKDRKVLPAGTIGMDSLSTIDLFCDSRMLTNIRRVPEVMRLRCNAGYKIVKHVGHLAGYGDVWFDRDAVANILSLSQVTSRFQVTFDSEGEEGFILHLPDGRKRTFRKTDTGLYATQFLKSKTSQECEEVVFTISADEGNKSKSTRLDQAQADDERDRSNDAQFTGVEATMDVTERTKAFFVSPSKTGNNARTTHARTPLHYRSVLEYVTSVQ